MTLFSPNLQALYHTDGVFMYAAALAIFSGVLIYGNLCSSGFCKSMSLIMS